MSRLKQLIQEVHRRSLWQVLGIYVAVSWVVFQVVQTLTEGLGLPEWFPAFALGLLLIGLPIVLATALVQEGGLAIREADPTLIPHGEASTAASTAREETGLLRLFSWRNAITGGVLAFALWGVVATGWLLFQDDRSGASSSLSPGLASIAVLPFLNMSADSANEYFSDGVTEEIITALSKIKNLKVVSRSATFRYKGEDVDPREVGSALGVGAILEGSVRKEGNRIRITAQLINVEDGFHLWSEHYDRRYEAIFEIQDEVATKIAEALRLNLTESEYTSIQKRATDDLEAYEYYSRGRHEFYKYTLEGNAAAIEYFEHALERDPNFSLALAGLSLAHSQYINRNWADDEDWLVKAEAAARKALATDPNLPEGHFALGFVYEKRFLWDLEKAEMEIVLAENPNHAHAHDSLGDVYFFRGFLDEALKEFAMALRLDPFLPPSHYRTADALRLKGQYQQAIGAYRKSLEILPDVDWLHYGLAETHREQGNYELAIEAYEAAIALEPDNWIAYIGLAQSHFAVGDVAALEATAERLLWVDPERDKLRAVHTYILGYSHLARGDIAGAIRFFRRARALDPPSRFGSAISQIRFYEIAIAEALLARGEGRSAAELLEEILRVNPFLKRLRYQLAAALEAAGEPDRAIIEYEKFLEDWKDADPELQPRVEAARRAISALSPDQ